MDFLKAKKSGSSRCNICSIVAREYGIPAIVLAGSTELFEDGQKVRINGEMGTIEILD